MTHAPLKGAQIDAFRKQAVLEADKAIKSPAAAGTYLPALYLAGLAEARGEITPENIDAAINHRRPLLETLLPGSDTVEQKIALMNEVLQASYTHAQGTPATSGRKTEMNPFASLTYEKSKALPITAEQQDYFVRIALEKATQPGFRDYRADMAMMAGMLDAQGSITEKKVEEMAWSRPHLHPDPDFRALTATMISALTAGRGFTPKPVEVKPATTVEPEPVDLRAVLSRKVEKMIDKATRHQDWSIPQAVAVSRISNALLKNMEQVTERSLTRAVTDLYQEKIVAFENDQWSRIDDFAFQQSTQILGEALTETLKSADKAPDTKRSR